MLRTFHHLVQYASKNRLKSALPLKGLYVHLKIGFLLCFRVKIPICRIFFENSVRTYVRPYVRTYVRPGAKKSPKKGPILMVFTRCRVSSSSHSRVPVRSIYHAGLPTSSSALGRYRPPGGRAPALTPLWTGRRILRAHVARVVVSFIALYGSSPASEGGVAA